MAKITREAFKTYNSVFDAFTNRALFRLESKKMLGDATQLQPISVGKESNVFLSYDPDGNPVIIKIYRVQNCNFNTMFTYLRQDNRFMDLKKQRRTVIFSWVKREWHNLIKAHRLGFSVPRPIALDNHIIIMQAIGTPYLAPQLKHKVPTDAPAFQKKVLAFIEQYKKQNMVHGDLSSYNILNNDEEPVFIDFSQACPYDSYFGKELYKRDLHNIHQFFEKIKQ